MLAEEVRRGHRAADHGLEDDAARARIEIGPRVDGTAEESDRGEIEDAARCEAPVLQIVGASGTVRRHEPHRASVGLAAVSCQQRVRRRTGRSRDPTGDRMRSPDSASSPPSPGRRAIHLWVLSAFAVAQPLFDLLGRNATFFLARGATLAEILIVAAFLLVGPPLLVWLVEWLVERASPRAAWMLHLAFVGALAFVLLQPPLGRSIGGDVALFLAAAAAVAVLFLYARRAGFRSFLGFLWPVPLAFAAFFLAGAQMRPLLVPRPPLPFAAFTTSRDPVVFVLLDEISTSSLMKRDGTIDERLFPNFARLARQSTWFRNATSVLPMTDFVLPILLSGSYRDGVRLPIFESYSDNLFSFLAGSHRIVALESVSAMCPPNTCEELLPAPPLADRLAADAQDLAIAYGHVALPERWRSLLPSIDLAWGGFAAPAKPVKQRDRQGRTRHQRQLDLSHATNPFAIFESFIGALAPSERPTLFFLHVLLPHVPWASFPSGVRYPADDRPDGAEGAWKTWSSEEWPTEVALQRYLLQLGNVDRLLGQLLDRLEETGLWDRALFVLVGDHGVNFLPGQMYRQPTDASVRDLMHVPFFVKQSGQTEGRISDRNVESIDVLPTVADALGTKLPFPVQGTSALGDAPERPTKRMYAGGESWELDAAPPSAWPGLERKLALFGEDGRWESVERFSTRPDMIARALADFRIETGPAVGHAEVDHLERFADVDREGGFVPAYVKGTATTGSEAPREVAVALNGTVWAAGPTFAREGGAARFSLILPEAAFRHGENEVRIFAIEESGGLRPLDLAPGA